MSGYNATSMHEARTTSGGRPTSSSINHHLVDGHHGQASITVLRPYGTGGSQQPKRVLVPTHSRTITGSYTTPPYRTVVPRFNALSRLDYVPDEKDGNKKSNGLPFSSDASANKPIYRSNDKSRGLRHFSTKVCEKVKEKGRTNYNEVADELVAEYFDSLGTPPQSVEKQQYDMKNIRRRVYDALNVLMAMNIIEKEKKEIRWVGLPTSSLQECRRYEEEKLQRQESIRKKTEQLQELVIQLVAYKTLVQRNRENEKVEGRLPETKLIYLPFIVLNTTRDTVVDCSIASDKTEFLFNFDQPFEIHDDIEILKRLGLSYGLEKDDVQPEYREHIRNCLPQALRDYADQIIDGTLTANVTSHLPAQKIQPAMITGQNPADVKVPMMRPVSGAVRAIVPTNRGVKNVIRPRNMGGATYRVPVGRAAGQPYTIPPSSVYRSTVQQQYSLHNGRVVSGQRYVQRAIPRLQTSYNPHMGELATHDTGVMHYEEDYGEEYEQYEQ